MANPSTLISAYGRDYKSKEEAVIDLNDQKNFRIENWVATAL